MKAFVAIVICGFIVVVATGVIPEQQVAHATPQEKSDDGDATDDSSELSTFMRKKLDASNQILEGLVIDDLKKIDMAAERLLKMSDAERWRASTDMMYMHHSREFRGTVETMREKARNKSIDGAALAWMDVTMSCIRCHEWVRDTMLADIAPAFPSDTRISSSDAAEDQEGAK